MWKGPIARSLPISIFGFTSVAGIALGPFVGSAIQAGVNWRWWVFGFSGYEVRRIQSC